MGVWHRLHNPAWNAGQGLFQSERARPTVRGKAALHQPFHRGEPNRSSAMKCRTAMSSGPQGSMSAPILAATRAADSFTESRARWA